MRFRTLNTVMLNALIVVTAGALCAFASEQKSNSASTSDPVMQALNHGVDHLDGVNPSSTDDMPRRDARYVVVDGDIMDLQFEFTPDFNQTVTVEPDGFITLKDVGDLHVAGDNLPQIRQKLEQAYAKVLAKPQISVFLKDFQHPYFLALGQFTRPGKYDLRGETTVAEAVAIAGGYTMEARHTQVLLLRRVNTNWSSVTKINLKHMLSSKTPTEDLILQPGDMLYIPQSRLSKVKGYIPNPSMGAYTPLP